MKKTGNQHESCDLVQHIALIFTHVRKLPTVPSRAVRTPKREREELFGEIVKKYFFGEDVGEANFPTAKRADNNLICFG